MEGCFSWIKTKYGLNANSSMSEVNAAFRDWNMGALVLISVLILPGMLGNSLVMAIFYRDFKKSAYRTFVLWLAALDLAGCMIVMPYLMVNIITPVTMDNEIVCKLGRFLSYVIMMTSHFILVVIAADRYRKICKPHSLQIPQSQTSRYCLGMLTLSIVVSIPAPILYGNSTLDIGIPGLKATRCFTADEYMDTPAHLIYYGVINALGGTITVIITALYVQVIRRIRYQFREKEHEIARNIRRNAKLSENGNACEVKINRKLVRTTVTLLAVTVVFVITIFPHTVLALVDYSVRTFYCRLSFSDGVMFNIAMHFFLPNNVLNSVIYGFTDKRFKKRFLLLFRRQQFNVNGDYGESSDAISSDRL
ncbi:kappa-type opioid receptor-like [Ostrea edulis]|uniref:kappa-type opioid receptor-like n=1 Tax=Ostrea edulis TaxID=37623 RepID=UPI00209599A0|nr:kappa-type opioid receptor-like [Ostrea edulis]